MAKRRRAFTFHTYTRLFSSLFWEWMGSVTLTRKLYQDNTHTHQYAGFSQGLFDRPHFAWAYSHLANLLLNRKPFKSYSFRKRGDIKLWENNPFLLSNFIVFQKHLLVIEIAQGKHFSANPIN